MGSGWDWASFCSVSHPGCLMLAFFVTWWSKVAVHGLLPAVMRPRDSAYSVTGGLKHLQGMIQQARGT